MFSVAKKISYCNHLWIFMIYPFYVVNSTTVLHHYLLFFLNHFTRFSAYINHIFIVYSTEVLGFFISSFVSLYSLNTIVTKINLWCLLYESIKALEIKTSNVFNLAFANNTIWSWFFLFFLTIDLYFLIAAVSVHIFNPTAECAVPIGINN